MGSLQSSGAEQRHGEGQAALVVLAVEVQPALYSSSLNKTRMPGLMLWLCSDIIEATPDIIDRSIEIRNYTNIRTKDSIHLACGEKSKVDCFLRLTRSF